MKELNDQDFDNAIKHRVTEEFPEYEEESWLKMEQKLRKKDRFIFYRNASIILLFLSFGLGFYFVAKNDKIKSVESFAAKKQVIPNQANEVIPSVTTEINAAPSGQKTAVQLSVAQKADKTHSLDKQKQQIKGVIGSENQISIYAKADPVTKAEKDFTGSRITKNEVQQNSQQATDVNSATTNESLAQVEMPKTDVAATPFTFDKIIEDSTKKKPVIAKTKRKIPISLAISAGPDFNSTSALVGGKTSVAFGFTVGVGLTKKLSLQTGLGFGLKNYNASGADYTFAVTNPSNPYGPGTAAFQSTIAEINAACKVLEIPLVASYLFANDQKRSISFNAGLSSYFMLKEEYNLKYTAASGKADRLNEYSNANQHILSVVNLSATYNFKLKNKHLGFGIEPYVKIPLTGIGEGSVPLKSSGISLKLQYDFNRR